MTVRRFTGTYPFRRKVRTETTRHERGDGRGWSETYTPIYEGR